MNFIPSKLDPDIIKMTLCFGVQPFGLATLYSDVVVSGENAPERWIESRFPELYRPIARQLRNPHRKIYPLSDSFAVACAGNAAKIFEFLQEVEGYANFVGRHAFDAQGDARPLDVVSRLADQIGNLEITGFEARVHEDESVGVNWMHQGSSSMETGFGIVTYGGSGSKDFVKRVSYFQQNSFLKSLVENKNSLQIVLDFGGYIFNSSFDKAIHRGDNKLDLPDYGGVFDMLVRDYAGGGWCWGPDTLHLFCEILASPGQEFSIYQVPIFVAHYPEISKVVLGVVEGGAMVCEEVFIPKFTNIENGKITSGPWPWMNPIVHVRTNLNQGIVINTSTISKWSRGNIQNGGLSNYVDIPQDSLQDLIIFYINTVKNNEFINVDR